MAVVISTSLPIEIWKEIREKHLKYNQLIMQGLQSSKGMPFFTERQNTLEAENRELRASNEKLYAIVRKLQGDINALAETEKPIQ